MLSKYLLGGDWVKQPTDLLRSSGLWLLSAQSEAGHRARDEPWPLPSQTLVLLLVAFKTPPGPRRREALALGLRRPHFRKSVKLSAQESLCAPI